METISSIDKKLQITSTHHPFQTHYLQIYTQKSKQSSNQFISILNPKSSFLKHASSLLQFTYEEEIPHQFQIYEESQLIHPHQSLILKYQNLKKGIQNQPIQQVQHRFLSGIQKLYKILQIKTQNQTVKKSSNSSQTLIDILALSSVQNFYQNDEKIILQHAFHQLKLFFNKSKTSHKPLRPLLPIDKKHQIYASRNQFPKNSIIFLDRKKKQGVEQLTGSLTFKVLEIQSQSFKILKQTSKKKILQKFIKKLSFVLFQDVFVKINQYEKQSTLSKYDSKLLTLSKSKSKGSLSKLRIHNLKSNSEKKILSKRLNSYQNGDFSIQSQQNFNERIINSEILSDFDFTQLQSTVNDQEYEIETKKKLQFNNRLKKKSIKESASQVETLNSLRSLQSDEYQFYGGNQSTKITSSLKPISMNKFNTFQIEQDGNMPTTKIINYDVKKKKTSFQEKFYTPMLNEAKQIQLFSMKERRYMNVRTNLFELPFQTDFEKDTKISHKKEKMVKVYHLMPQSLIKSDVLNQEKDNFLTSIKGLNVSQYLNKKQITVHKNQFKNVYEKKYKNTQTTQTVANQQNLQNYYFQSKNTQNQKYTPKLKIKTEIASSKQKSPLDNGIQKIKFAQANQSTQNFIKNEPKNIYRAQNLKTKKPLKGNFQQYYFKAQIKNTQTLNPNLSRKLTNQLLIKEKYPQNHIDQLPKSKDFYEDQYRTSKILSQRNVKIVKSLSPSIKISLHSPYRTGKLGNRVLNKNHNNQTVSRQSQNSSKMSLQKYSTIPSNFQPLQMQSSVNTPTNIHQFAEKPQQNVINTHRSGSKLKVFSQTPRSLSPHQNNLAHQHFTNESIERKVSFIVNQAPNITEKAIMSGPPSNTIHITQQGSNFIPTISNLSNQSKFQNTNQSINQVINYGPNVGFNQQTFNRPSSILSTYSNQSKQKKIVIDKPSQVLMSPTQRIMHEIENQQKYEKNVIFPRSNAQRNQFQHEYSQKRGLNVMMRNNSFHEMQNSEKNNFNITRQNDRKNQKIFYSPRK